MFKIFISAIFLCASICLCTEALKAQDLLKAKDLSQIKVDQLNDGDIAKLKAQLAGAGISIDQAEQTAIAKGMPIEEFAKLRKRLEAFNSNNNVNKLKSGNEHPSARRVNNSSDSLDIGRYEEKPPKSLIDPLIFGSELYTSVSPSFEPNMKLATPLNYVLGPDDQLQVSVYGVQEYNGDLQVSSEGIIAIPNVGQLKVAGLTIEAATQKLRSAMANSVYPSLKSGSSKLSVSLGNIRTIKVTIIGANRPGNYSLSSLSTVLNALYVAGGPTPFGSFRNIELVRNNKVERRVDLYQLLLHGDQSNNIGLKDNDIIRIPAYKTRVELKGQVKRPGIFEVLPNESFSDILEFASGFTDTAYQASVKIYQQSATDRKIEDLDASSYKTYHPKSGDVFVASKILDRFQNRVQIVGAVFRPDVYELTPGLRVADLIRKADGLREDAFTGRGQIIRLQEDLTRSIVSFDIKRALAGNPDDNSILQREDMVLVSSVLDLRDSFKISIQGEVRMPGTYDYVQNLSLKDLILQAGGFTDAAFKKIEIARLIKRDSVIGSDTRASSILNIDVNGDLTFSSANLQLQPFDVVTVRRKAGYILPETVTVSGEVQYPGPYALSDRNEKVSDILSRAGGFMPDAYPAGAYLKRFRTVEEQKKMQSIRAIEQKLHTKPVDSIPNHENEDYRTFEQIPLDIASIQREPGSSADLNLRVNDELVIPKFDGEIRIEGNVLMTTMVPFQKGNNFKDYIDEAGGFSGNAWRKKAYVVYANGKAATIKHFLFFKFYPEVLPGSTIKVPVKPERQKLSSGEIIGIGTAVASLAGVIIAILRL